MFRRRKEGVKPRSQQKTSHRKDRRSQIQAQKRQRQNQKLHRVQEQRPQPPLGKNTRESASLQADGQQKRAHSSPQSKKRHQQNSLKRIGPTQTHQHQNRRSRNAKNKRRSILLSKQTIDVLDDSNKYIKDVQEELEKKDWRNILDEAQQKYEIEWPDDREEINEDPAFQEMWKELGGEKAVNKVVEKKRVNVEIAHQQQHQKHQER